MMFMLLLIVFMVSFVAAVVKNAFTIMINPNSIAISTPARTLEAFVLAPFIMQTDVTTISIMQCTMDKTSM